MHSPTFAYNWIFDLHWNYSYSANMISALWKSSRFHVCTLRSKQPRKMASHSLKVCVANSVWHKIETQQGHYCSSCWEIRKNPVLQPCWKIFESSSIQDLNTFETKQRKIMRPSMSKSAISYSQDAALTSKITTKYANRCAYFFAYTQLSHL